MRRMLLSLLVTYWLTGLTGNAAAQQVAYAIAFPNAVHHEAEVEVTFTGLPPGQPLELRMSRTSPGRYALHEFAKNVYNVSAFDGRNRRLDVTRPDPHQWNIGGHDGTVRVTYTLFGDRADGTYAAIDLTHAHLNMPATFMWARGLEDAPVRIVFEPPHPEWNIATQLFPTEANNVFEAPDLAYFLDSPTELSAHRVRTWVVASNGDTYQMRLIAHHDGTEADLNALTDLIRAVVGEQIAIYGETPAFDTGWYTFIGDFLPYVESDAMEHRNSTVVTSPISLSGIGARLNLSALAHEFFHSWNVERIRPESLEPFDLEEASMSGELWFAEGFTNYYTHLSIRRAGIIDDRVFADRNAAAVNAAINAPGRGFFSPVEMSMRAPFVDGARSIDAQNRDNTFISYYTWGQAIGLGLDLTLRNRYGATLDDYMRSLWVEFGRTERPYTLPDLQRVLGEISGDVVFAADFFDRFVFGREAIDYTTLLATAGFLLQPANPGEIWLGAAVIDRRGQAEVGSTPLIGSPLYDAGIDAGAVLLEAEGARILAASDLLDLIEERSPGDRIPVTYEARGQQRQTTLVLAEDPGLEIVLYENAGLPVTDAIRALRREWLGSKAAPQGLD